ncbi:pentatricopeptide repeat-containing protein [Pyrus ussuriensis x Pyrus communis]|uniref:Pentatricopeptide repeat-containing protein n=1 Tax=Pyrus ussuriensis x Pyrus communis TaxID=2448454 RepID=A0A5N5GU81_9ROSA|nr:pentatricopeptide repeat-containing protein [Pyrus ussuriensis x Pyrus communis]
MLTTKHRLTNPIIQHRYAPRAYWLSKDRSPWNTMSNTTTHGRQQKGGGGVRNTRVGRNIETRSTISESMTKDRNLNDGRKGMLAR